MATTVVPSLIDALVSQLTTAAAGAFNVYDGVYSAQDLANYIVIGAQSLDIDNIAPAVDNTQTWAHTNYTGIDEDGHVHCVAVAHDGGSVMKTARDACYSIITVVENTLRDKPSLGLANVLWTKALSTDSLYQTSDDGGLLVAVGFSIHFRARI